jgi:hypothetical protein
MRAQELSAWAFHRVLADVLVECALKARRRDTASGGRRRIKRTLNRLHAGKRSIQRSALLVRDRRRPVPALRYNRSVNARSHTHGISQKKAKCPMPLVAPKTSLKAASTSFPFAETGEAGSSTTCHTERNGHASHTDYAALATLKKQHLHTLAQLQTLEDRRRGDNRPRFR